MRYLVALLAGYGTAWALPKYWIPLAAYNAAAFLIYGIDKALAKLGKKRISENALFWLAAAGGVPGTFLGMVIFWHKVSKKAFFLRWAAIAVLAGAGFVANKFLPRLV